MARKSDPSPLHADREFARGFIARIPELAGARPGQPRPADEVIKAFMRKLGPSARRSVPHYTAGLLDAVRNARKRGLKVPADHDLELLFDSPENYERFGHDMPSWLIGWLTGAAEVAGITPEVLVAISGKVPPAVTPPAGAADRGRHRARSGPRARRRPR